MFGLIIKLASYSPLRMILLLLVFLYSFGVDTILINLHIVGHFPFSVWFIWQDRRLFIIRKWRILVYRRRKLFLLFHSLLISLTIRKKQIRILISLNSMRILAKKRKFQRLEIVKLVIRIQRLWVELRLNPAKRTK